MLARGSGIAALHPLMGESFSRRALYRHRQRHMNAVGAPAARPVPFPHDGSALEKIRWAQREAEHTAAMAERQSNLGAKVKAIHEISRLIWLEHRVTQGAEEDDVERQYRQHLESINRQMETRLREARVRRTSNATSGCPTNEPVGTGTSS
jgi:hypothetical protein